MSNDAMSDRCMCILKNSGITLLANFETKLFLIFKKRHLFVVMGLTGSKGSTKQFVHIFQ